MTFDEFTARVKARPFPSVEEYATIEYVYMYHPAIEDKDAIAAIYDAGGMAVIRDMRPRAAAAEIIEREQRQARAQLNAANEKMRKLKNADIPAEQLAKYLASK